MTKTGWAAGNGATGTNKGGEPQDWFAFTARRLVAAEFKVAESDLARSSRCPAPVAFARQVAMYMAHVAYQLSYAEVAQAFGRDRSTVSHACAMVEDARDDPDLEYRLDKIERRMNDLARIAQGRPTAARMAVHGIALRAA